MVGMVVCLIFYGGVLLGVEVEYVVGFCKVEFCVFCFEIDEEELIFFVLESLYSFFLFFVWCLFIEVLIGNILCFDLLFYDV